MKILFTKILDEQVISETLGSHFSYDFEEVIKIREHHIQPFYLKNYSLIFTSVNGVKAFFHNGFQPNENFAEANYNRIYAVGKKTKAELRKNGFGTFKVFRNAQEMCEFIIENANSESFLHFCGDLSLDILNEALPLQNIQYKKIIVYTTDLLEPKITSTYDVLVFFSPSGVRSFVKNNALSAKFIFSIGATTEAELKKYTNQTIYSSSENHLKDLLHLMKEKLTAY